MCDCSIKCLSMTKITCFRRTSKMSTPPSPPVQTLSDVPVKVNGWLGSAMLSLRHNIAGLAEEGHNDSWHQSERQLGRD